MYNEKGGITFCSPLQAETSGRHVGGRTSYLAGGGERLWVCVGGVCVGVTEYCVCDSVYGCVCESVYKCEYEGVCIDVDMGVRLCVCVYVHV